MAKAENTRPSCVLLRCRSALTSGATVAMLTLSTYRMKYIAQSSPKTIPGGLGRIIRTNGYPRRPGRLGGFPGHGTAEHSRSCARPGFTLNLGPMHDSARGRLKGITSVHGAPVVPQDKVACAPLVAPEELLTSRRGP